MDDDDREDIGELLGDLDTLRRGEFMSHPVNLPLDIARLAELGGRAADWIDRLLNSDDVRSDTEYTPSTEEVRQSYMHLTLNPVADAAEFDRWLAVHDAQVRAETIKEVSK